MRNHLNKLAIGIGFLLSLVCVQVVLAAAVELISTSLYVNTPPQRYFREEGNANDTQGNGNGTDTNITYTSTNCAFGQCAIFSGTAYQTFATTSLVFGAGDRTINFWAYLQNGAEQVMLNYGAQLGGLQYFDWEVVDVGAGFRQFFNGGTDQSLKGATTITLPGLYMMTFTKCGPTSTLYQNGVFQNSVTVAYNTDSTTNQLHIGTNESLNTNLTGNALIDDAAFWNTCLSSTTINQLYNGTLPPLATGARQIFINNWEEE